MSTMPKVPSLKELKEDLVATQLEILELRKKLWQYQDAVMDMVNQHCRASYKSDENVMSDMALSANEDTFYLLEKDGLIKRLPGKYERYRLNWDLLAELKKSIEEAE